MPAEHIPDHLIGSKVERVIPGAEAVSSHLVREHIKRYNFAAPQVTGLKVLDLACGSGYGSFILAQEASEVLGMDLEAEAIAYCKLNHRRDNLTYQVGDAQNLGTISDNAFDAVVSFETIEHLPDYRAYLSEVRRVLRPAGLFFVSTPDAGFALKARLPPASPNPYHVHEFELEELHQLLQPFFQNITMYGQQFYLEPPVIKKRIQMLAYNILAHPLYQRIRNNIPRVILQTGVRFSGIDNDSSIRNLESSVGTPEILLAICK